MPNQHSWESVAKARLYALPEMTPAETERAHAEELFSERMDTAVGLIRGALWNNDALLKAKYRIPDKHPLYGHCYVASEVLFYLAKLAGLRRGSFHVKVGTITHWFVNIDGHTIDPTYDQFGDDVVIPYSKAIPCGFLTNDVSKRGVVALNLIRDHFNQTDGVANVQLAKLLRDIYVDASKIRANLYTTSGTSNHNTVWTTATTSTFTLP